MTKNIQIALLLVLACSVNFWLGHIQGKKAQEKGRFQFTGQKGLNVKGDTFTGESWYLNPHSKVWEKILTPEQKRKEDLETAKFIEKLKEEKARQEANK